jgi:hypothetical protein
MATMAVIGLIMVWNAAYPLARGDVRRAGFTSPYDAVALLVFGVLGMAFGIAALWALGRRAGGGRPVYYDKITRTGTTGRARTDSGAVTVRSGARQGPIVLMFLLAILAPEPAFSRPRWAEHLPAAAVAGYLVAVATVVVLVCVRALLMGVRFEDKGITVRNLRSTRRVAWQDVERLTDESILNSRRELELALKIVLRDGSSVTATGAKGLRADGLETISRAAARYGIPASITGQAGPPQGHSGG